MKLRGLLPAAVLLAAGSLAACGPHYGRGYAYNVPPPPPPAYGAYGRAPGPGYVWAEGFYDLRGNNWVWVRGHWARPPRAHAVWVPPRWEQNGRRWSRREGHWR